MALCSYQKIIPVILTPQYSRHTLKQKYNIHFPPNGLKLPALSWSASGLKIMRYSSAAHYPIDCFHIDIAEFHTDEGKLYLFVAIDRTSKFAVAQLVDKANRNTAWDFLETVLEAVPYKVHTILTDNGIQFFEQPRNRNTAYSRPMRVMPKSW